MSMNILELLDGKWTDGTRPKDIYEFYISKNPSDYVKAIIEGLSSEKRKVQSGSAELASLLSENNPELIYPHINLFIENLDAEAPVLRWEAVCTIGNLTKADKNRIIPAHIDHIVSFLSNKSIVLQGHSVRALSKIAETNPKEAPRILDRLLESREFFPENRIGFIIEEMKTFLHHEKLKNTVKNLVKPYLKSDIKSVSRKAKKILKTIEAS